MQGIKKRKAEKRNIHFSALRYEEWKLSLPVEGIRIWQIIALDNLKRRGSELNIPFLKSAGVEFTHGDIRNGEDLHFDGKIDFIIDAAAEPSILAGLNETPDYLIRSLFALNYLMR